MSTTPNVVEAGEGGPLGRRDVGGAGEGIGVEDVAVGRGDVDVAGAQAERAPWDAVRAALSAFLDACLEPAFRRVVALDSVGVLQQDAWEGGIEHNELPMLRTVLTPLVDAELLPGLRAEPLVHVALGGLYGAALFIARSPDPRGARCEAEAVLDAVVAGLRAHLVPGATTPSSRT